MELSIQNLELYSFPILTLQDNWNKKGDNAIRATRKQPSSRVSNITIGFKL